MLPCTWLRLWSCPAVRTWRAQGAWKAAGWRGAGRLQPAPFFPLDPQVPRDVVLFQHDRRGFFRLMGLFCAGQGLFWGYLAHFAFHTLSHSGATPESTQKEAGPDPEHAGGRPKPTLPGGASLNLGSDKWRLGFTASCLTIGKISRKNSGSQRGGSGHPWWVTNSWALPSWTPHISVLFFFLDNLKWIFIRVKRL